MPRRIAWLALALSAAVVARLPAESPECRRSFELGKSSGAEHRWDMPPVALIAPSLFLTSIGCATAIGLANPDWYRESTDLQAMIVYPTAVAAVATGLTAGFVSLLYRAEPESVPAEDDVDSACYADGYRRGAWQRNMRRTVQGGLAALPFLAIVMPLFGLLASLMGPS